jgi:ribonuclease D
VLAENPFQEGSSVLGHVACETPGHAAFEAPGRVAFEAPGHVVLEAPGHVVFEAPGHGVFEAPGQVVFEAPGHVVFEAPGHVAGDRPRATGNSGPHGEYPPAMSYRLIQEDSRVVEVAPQLAAKDRMALDCEAAGFHRYTDRLCLVQVSTPNETLLFDPLLTDPSTALRPPLEDPQTLVVMHGADYDLRLLDRDLGIRVRGLFDTQVAASLLGAPSLGLAALLETHLGVLLSKEHQRADWAKRPLPEAYLEYAAADTQHLLKLGDLLDVELRRAGREAWAREEFRLLEGIRWEADGSDPVTRVKGARALPPRQIAALRAAMAWRDRIAREMDRAPFRVVGDQALLAVVAERPRSLESLASVKGMSPQLARRHGRELLSELQRVDLLSEGEVPPSPRWNPNGHGRPTPEEEALADRLRSLRADRAHDLGLDRGVLLSNVQISEIVRTAPRSMAELEGVPGVRKWQAELLGGEILRILR